MRLRPQGARNDEERILPVINVVFLLLVFFMLAGRLSASDPLGIEPPMSSSQTPARNPAIVVLVAANGRLALDGETVDRTQLVAAVRKRMSANMPEVHLRADGRAPALRVIGIMENLRGAGAEKLLLLTVPEGR